MCEVMVLPSFFGGRCRNQIHPILKGLFVELVNWNVSDMVDKVRACAIVDPESNAVTYVMETQIVRDWP